MKAFSVRVLVTVQRWTQGSSPGLSDIWPAATILISVVAVTDLNRTSTAV
jgi:hypothetical protein